MVDEVAVQELIKSCALCNSTLKEESKLNICSECLNCADCCVGLERISTN